MGLDLRLTRTILVAGFGADPNPNTTPPDPQDVFKFDQRVPSGGIRTTGHVVSPAFDVAEGASVDFTSWIKTEDGVWRPLKSEAAAADHGLFRVIGTMNSPLFVQVTALNGVVASTELVISAGEAGDVST